jgi:uncharacterized protein
MRTEPFHDGEIAVQERAGERDIARQRGAIISPRIAPGALSFLAQQRLIALSAAGDDGQLWTSVWCGEPGFVRSEDGQRVSILPPMRSLMPGDPDDPVLRRLGVGREIGILAIELASRRRIRINGTVDGVSAAEVGVVVRESVPNCPKYIQRREPSNAPASSSSRRPTESGRALDQERRFLIARADTAFVGSLHTARGVDTSHRGGVPGFIQIVDATTLRVPDYPGNSMFMTLGNFEVDSRASLAVLDFARGLIVCFSGSATLHFEIEQPQLPTGGTGRYWDFAIREWMQCELPSVRGWELIESSPFNPPAAGK